MTRLKGNVEKIEATEAQSAAEANADIAEMLAEMRQKEIETAS